jgi:hypothetical protein
MSFTMPDGTAARVHVVKVAPSRTAVRRFKEGGRRSRSRLMIPLSHECRGSRCAERASQIPAAANEARHKGSSIRYCAPTGEIGLE